MNDTIVIGGQAEMDGQIDGQMKIDSRISGECGIFFPVTPPPAPVEELVIKDVMFMDYDGTVVASYDAADFIANVTSLPTPPSHDGLTFQEWNWDLEDIKTELQTGSGACCIGACYETTDGKTHIYIDLQAIEGSRYVNFYIAHISGTHTVNWGDGTTDSYSSSSYARHLYSSYGEYEITIDGGEWGFSGTNEGLRTLPMNSDDWGGTWYVHTNTFMKKIYTGTGCKTANTNTNIFRNCPNFTEISVHKNFIYESGQENLSSLFFASGIKFFVFPKGIGASSSTSGSVMSNVFTGCPNIVTVSFPKGFRYLMTEFNYSCVKFVYFPYIATMDTKATYITFAYCNELKRVAMAFDSVTTTYANGFYATFQYAYGLEQVSFEKMKFSSPNRYTAYNCANLRGEVSLPSTVTVLTGDNFRGCSSVPKFTLLGSLTSIGANTFYACYSCLEWDFTHCSAVPTLANTNAFSGIRPTAVIKVPAALEASWKTAANWSNYASYIVGV